MELHGYKVWLGILLPLLFVSDILYGGMALLGIKTLITPGIILRGMVVATAIFMIVKWRRILGTSLLGWIVLIVVSVLPAFVIGSFYGKSAFFNIISLSKALYLPFVTGLFVVIIRRYRVVADEVLRFIEYSAYVLGLSLLLSQMVGFEKQTYGDYAFGSTGVFYAQNDITLAFGLAMLASGYRLVMGHYSLIRAILLGMSAYACVQIGTRASLAVVAGVAMTAAACLIWSKTSAGRQRGRILLRNWMTPALLVIALLGILGYALSIHMGHGYQHKKLEQIVKGGFPRQELVLAGMRHIEERGKWLNVFGEGADSFQRGVSKHFGSGEGRRVVEVDWVDSFGNYGVMFTILIHGFVLVPLVVSGYRFLARREPLSGLLASASLLYIGHSAVAGHALMSPIPSTLMAAYLALYFTSMKSRRDVES